MDKCREEFEIEFSKVSNRLLNKYKTQNDNEKYIDNFVEAAFIGFKLSRESMKAIKLPDKQKYLAYDDTYISGEKAGHNKLLAVVTEAITSAGYKVEE